MKKRYFISSIISFIILFGAADNEIAILYVLSIIATIYYVLKFITVKE
jgi:hypothetical protein